MAGSMISGQPLPRSDDALIRRIEKIERNQLELGPSIAKSFQTTVARLAEASIAPTYPGSFNTTAASSGNVALGFAPRPEWASRAVITHALPEYSSGLTSAGVGATIIHGSIPGLAVLDNNVSSVIGFSGSAVTSATHRGCIIDLTGELGLYTVAAWGEAPAGTGIINVDFTPLITWIE